MERIHDISREYERWTVKKNKMVTHIMDWPAAKLPTPHTTILSQLPIPNSSKMVLTPPNLSKLLSSKVV